MAIPILRSFAALLLFATLSLPVLAQTPYVVDDEEGWCDDGWSGDRDTVRLCEVREVTLDAGRSLVEVDGGANGGIRVEGWDRDVILVRAKVQVRARSEERARRLLGDTTIRTDLVVEATTPDTRRRESTSVSFHVYVPRQSDLSLETRNGGIAIAEVDGEIDFRATNGGVSLTRLAGDVQGRTSNGGLTVQLDGRRWDGDGLDVETTNGGVTVVVPEGYNAAFETGTVNGQIDLDFPVRVQGRVGRSITTTLGSGGAPIRVRTTNGGVRVKRG